MSDWLPALPNWFVVLGGIVLVHSLFLYSEFYSEAEGYMWRAARKIWFYLFLFFMIQWIIGAFFFQLAIGLRRYTSVPLLLFAGFIGVVVAATPRTLEHVLLPKTGATEETLEKPLTKLLLWLRADLRYQFAKAISSRREQDLYDCQLKNAWGLNVTPQVLGRRLRKLYECCKCDIAEKRQDLTLLRHDVGRNPWAKFYLLVRHVGRKRLRAYLRESVEPPTKDWIGNERRRILGTLADRNPSSDPDSPKRVYD